MLGKGRGKATYVRKRCIKQAEVLASARVPARGLGRGAAGEGGTAANPPCPPINMQSHGLALRNFRAALGGLLGRRAGIELWSDAGHRPTEQHWALPTPSSAPGDSAGSAAGGDEDLSREHRFCCKTPASCQGLRFPLRDGAQTAAVSPGMSFHGSAQAGRAQLLHSLGAAFAASSRGGLMAQESSWAMD